MAAAGPGPGTPITCYMLLSLHGAVFIKIEGTAKTGKSGRGSPPESPNISVKAMPLSDIGEKISVVAAGNISYSVMNSAKSKFPNYVTAFKNMIQADPTMDENKVSTLFNFYDSRLYSFFDDHITRQRKTIEDRFLARTTLEDLDMTQKLLTYYSNEMPSHDFIARMRTIRNALGLDWAPHYKYCIGNKMYCPGEDANQCCLYFPGVVATMIPRLQVNWSDFKEILASLESHIGKDLELHFSSAAADGGGGCVLTIVFGLHNGVVKNKLWEGIPLNRFLEYVTTLLNHVFSGVGDITLEQLMSQTCVIDAACSDFYVPGKEVSIIGFERLKKGDGVLAKVDVHDPDVRSLGFWEYWVRKQQSPPMAAAAAAAVPGQKRKATEEEEAAKHEVVQIHIPEELVEFVPVSLTSLESTIRNVKAAKDEEGNVHVTYTYHNGHKKTELYTPSVAGPISDSLEAVQGSLPDSQLSFGESQGSQDSQQLPNDFTFLDLFAPDDTKGLGRADADAGAGGGAGGRRYSTSKKRHNKNTVHKRKTIRLRRRLRCKMTRRMVAKGRGRRRTCARRL